MRQKRLSFLCLALLLTATSWAADSLPAVNPVYLEEFISPENFQKANHGSSIVEIPGGGLLACWYAGSAESAKDVQIYCSKKPLGGKWSSPQVTVVRHEHTHGALLKNKTLGNAVLHLDPQGALWLFYSSVMIGGWSASTVDYKVSHDFGETWGKPRRLMKSLGYLPRIKPLQLDSERFMLPLYHELLQIHGNPCILTVDHGKLREKICSAIPGDKLIQPALAQMPDGGILALLRNMRKGQAAVSRFDAVRGEWSKAEPTQLPNPDSSLETLVTPKGKLLVVFNNDSLKRNPLSLAVSDDGRSFRVIWSFENQPGVDFSYPSLIRASDGVYHLTYTYDGRKAIKHVAFDEEWLEQKLALPAY